MILYVFFRFLIRGHQNKDFQVSIGLVGSVKNIEFGISTFGPGAAIECPWYFPLGFQLFLERFSSVLEIHLAARIFFWD